MTANAGGKKRSDFRNEAKSVFYKASSGSGKIEKTEEKIIKHKIEKYDVPSRERERVGMLDILSPK